MSDLPANRSVRRWLRVAALAGVALALAPRHARAQEDWSVPDTPAFTYLGASPTRIARPTSAKDLAVALADGVDSVGRAQRGLAVDFAPWVLLPRRVTNAAYRSSRRAFIYANLQASLASVRAAGDTASTDLAVGLRTNLANGTDPLADAALGRRMDEAVGACGAAGGTAGPPNGAALETCADTAIARLVERWLDDEGHWNDFAWAVAGAFGSRLPQSRVEQPRARGGALWTTVAVPLGRSAGQALLHARGDWARAGGAARDTSAFTGGARLLYGGSGFNLFAELTGTWRNAGAKRRTTSSSAGAEFRTATSLWISAGVGTAYSERVQGTRVVLLANLKWSLSGAPRLAP